MQLGTSCNSIRGAGGCPVRMVFVAFGLKPRCACAPPSVSSFAGARTMLGAGPWRALQDPGPRQVSLLLGLKVGLSGLIYSGTRSIVAPVPTGGPLIHHSRLIIAPRRPQCTSAYTVHTYIQYMVPQCIST